MKTGVLVVIVAVGVAGLCLPARRTAAAPAPVDQTLTFRGRITAAGRGFVAADGQAWRYRGLSGFRLLEMAAHGNLAGVDAFLDYASSSGFTVVRVFAMARGLFSLQAGEGSPSLAPLLERARRRSLYLEVVALVDTGSYGLSRTQIAAQLDLTARICAAADNCLLEAANEIDHPTQSPELPGVIRAFVPPAGLTWTEGSPLDDESRMYVAGTYVVRHLDRGSDAQAMVSRVRVLEALSRDTGKPVVNDESIGACEATSDGRNADDPERACPEPGRRTNDPAVMAEMASLEARTIAGGTFLCDACQQGRVPGPGVRAIVKAWVDASRRSQDATGARFVDAGPLARHQDAPSGGVITRTQTSVATRQRVGAPVRA